MGSSGFLDSLRRWLDGEDAVSAAPATPVARSEWDDFFVLIAREVEAVMRREMFTPPGAATYLPVEYIVYLSREDDLQWQGRKREALGEGLRHVLSKRARELVGEKVLKTDRITITLGADGALEKGQVRVQEVWDDDSPRTEVSPRKQRPLLEPVVDGAPEVGGDERTMILPRRPRFNVEYRLGSGEAKTFAAPRNRIEIGRGSKDFVVDLKLDGDQEISRRHLLLERLGTGGFRLECIGRNPIEVDGVAVQPGEVVEVELAQTIRVGLYQLRILLSVTNEGKESK